MPTDTPPDTLSAPDAARLAQALLHGPDAVVFSDREGIIRFWNAAAERLFGFAAAEAVGRSLDIIIPERQRAVHWSGYATVMETGRSRYGAGDVLSVPALHKDGRRLSVEFTIAMLHAGDGGVDGIAAIMRDNTARFEEVKALRRQASGRG
ncbi:PAS domain S-box-containing protein [Constrictibacter sp. MBR-5]|jgi:PAS domain S-box-containing protein|uniref:PAS domain-containing protein n=1 Tax=Constrictibacter sp. MBR-5 TaxID=3156467 RepID=UPI0033955DC4